MEAKNVLYAAVGAPIIVGRKLGEQVEAWRAKVSEETSGYGKTAEETLTRWAAEGEKVVSRITDGAVVEEISSKVDLDQAKEQVSKLRDQLEDMLATWRTSFRPEASTPATTEAETPATTEAGTTAKSAPKTAAKNPPAKKPAGKNAKAS